MLDLIIGLDLANLPRLVGWVDLVAWLMNLINLVDLVSRNQALALGSVLRERSELKAKPIARLLSFVTMSKLKN